MFILVINSGSSSIKFHLFEMKTEFLFMACILERIGDLNGRFSCHKFSPGGTANEYVEQLSVTDHEAGLTCILEYFNENAPDEWMKSLLAIGHRVVHGGDVFDGPRLIDNHVIAEIQQLAPLAPLHNPVNLAGIEVMRQLCPDTPQVAVFDTAFFQTLPAHAYRYAIPDSFYQKHQVRRYGFHGTSHQYVAKQTAEYLQQPLEELKLISLHLGNGASAAAILFGKCIDTSMGMTPTEGLIMGTRCGDLDPAIPSYLAKMLKISFDEIDTLLNKESGLKGLCGVSDMREVQKLINKNDEQAQLAIDMYCYRICKYIGAYYLALGGLDALVFTAGVGENDSAIRQAICENLSLAGVTIDKQRNRNRVHGSYCISQENSKVSVLVIPTNEELEIFRQVVTVVN